VRRLSARYLTTVIGGLVFVAVMVVSLMFFAGFWHSGSSYEVSALVTNARGLASNATVTMAGLKVGKVTSIRRRGPDAILSLRIDRGPTPLPVDSRVAVRLRTVVGESYVEVNRGHSQTTVRDGGSLGLAHADDYVDVDQILQTLSGKSEGNARQTIQALGGAVRDRGPQLNGVLGSASAVFIDSRPLTATLAAQHNQVADLVQNLGTMMDSIGQRSTAVQEFATGSLRTFDAVAARDVALHRTLARLPYALAAFTRIANTLSVITPHVAPLATNLASALDQVSPAVDLLTPASNLGVPLVRALGAASGPLRTVLQNLERLQKPAAAALPEVRAALCEVNPMLKYTSPYGPDIASLFENMGSTANAYTASGHAVRAYPLVTPAAVAGAVTEPTAQAIQTLMNAGLAHGLNQNGYDPFPPPGHINDTTIGRGTHGPVDAGKLLEYTRVTAGEC
jgi:phospholipid/cholesterol/gamma-HCH transport system substrate-binding protein